MQTVIDPQTLSAPVPDVPMDTGVMEVDIANGSSMKRKTNDETLGEGQENKKARIGQFHDFYAFDVC